MQSSRGRAVAPVRYPCSILAWYRLSRALPQALIAAKGTNDCGGSCIVRRILSKPNGGPTAAVFRVNEEPASAVSGHCVDSNYFDCHHGDRTDAESKRVRAKAAWTKLATSHTAALRPPRHATDASSQSPGSASVLGRRRKCAAAERSLESRQSLLGQKSDSSHHSAVSSVGPSSDMLTPRSLATI